MLWKMLGTPMGALLRLAALLSLLCAAVLLAPRAFGVEEIAADPLADALAHGLAIANLGLALLFLRAARAPSVERTAIYTAMLVFGLRAANGTYQVLYRLDGGNVALLSLIEMVLSLALFVGMLNTLPSTLRPAQESPAGGEEEGA